MSTTSKRKKRPKGIDRPFKPELLKRARAIAARYQVLLWYEDGEWYGHGLELPTTYADGKTPTACVSATRRAMTATVAFMLERGEAPPQPALALERKGRSQQLNIRVSPEERLRLDELARQNGFRGAADYLRARALAG